MSGGWVKLHRKILDNELLWSDSTAFMLFVKLMLLANRQTGEYWTGRNALAEATGLKPITAYKALKRLQVAGIIQLRSNNRYTKISITKWSQYQDFGNNEVTTPITAKQRGSNADPVTTPISAGEHHGNNTVTLNKKEELRKRNTTSNLQAQIRRIYELYVSTFGKNPNQLKLTRQRQTKIGQRLKEFTEAEIGRAIVNASQDDFFNGGGLRGWFGNIDYLFRNTETMEKYVHLEAEDGAVSNLNERIENYV